MSVTVDGWGSWNVWIDVQSYAWTDRHTATPMRPSEAIRIAARLVLAAVVCRSRHQRDPARRHLTRDGAA